MTAREQPANEFITLPIKPLPPKDGTPSGLLKHAVEYGAYCQTLEQKLLSIQKWSEDR